MSDSDDVASVVTDPSSRIVTDEERRWSAWKLRYDPAPVYRIPDWIKQSLREQADNLQEQEDSNLGRILLEDGRRISARLASQNKSSKPAQKGLQR